jgi:branched-chain amino acid transport system ATP-binding protein
VTQNLLLSAVGVTVTFGGHRALSDVSFAARPGEITGLIGPNGAGKTTLFDVVTGMLTPSAGRVSFDGADISSLDPHQRARRGLARTFQRLELFGDLTVRDNLRVAGDARRTWGRRGIADFAGRRRRHRSATDDEVEQVLEMVGVAAVANERAGTLPTGTARLVELGRTLMLKPRLLLLDEPASGQSDEESARLAGLLRRLVSTEGLSIVLVEHDMALVMATCDRIHVLDFGVVIAVGAPADIRADERVRDAYLGAM